MMHETIGEFETKDEENVVGIWAFGLITIVLGGIAILYYLRYVDVTRLDFFSLFISCTSKFNRFEWALVIFGFIKCVMRRFFFSKLAYDLAQGATIQT